MSTTEVQTTSPDPKVGKIDMKLEIHVIAVSDVDRSKQFYERLGLEAGRRRRPAGRPSRRPVHAPGLRLFDRLRQGPLDYGAGLG